MAPLRRWWTWFRTVPVGPRSDGTAIRWWEARRPAYNAYLAAVGLPSLALHVAAVRLATGAMPEIGPVGAMAAVGWALANLFYTFTWLFELRTPHAGRRTVSDPAMYAFLVDAVLALTGLAATLPAGWELAFALRDVAGGHA
ncbi:hypothetical protein tb265_41390 [Gemmatimonadetes bacterium T265]|nr:hypothetical protein tb265_41390 [Gemmatimonadetes bacterium T265]